MKNTIKRRLVKDSIDKKTIQDAVWNYFSDSRLENDFYDLVVDIIDRIDFDDIDDVGDAVSEAIDSGFIYYDDEWTMLKHYANPKDVNYDEEFELFYNDIYSIVDDLVENKTDED